MKIVSEIEIGRKSNLNTMAVFLDVKSAYDNVKTDRLIRIGCSLYMLRYIQEWMCDRNTKFVINDEKCDTRLLNKGLPQGGVLSPTLYNIYILRKFQQVLITI